MRISNCIPYTAVTILVLFLEEVIMTCIFIPTILIQISATRTVRQAATALEATLLIHSWQDRIISIRMK